MTYHTKLFWLSWWAIMIGLVGFVTIVLPPLLKLEMRYLDWINGVLGCR